MISNALLFLKENPYSWAIILLITLSISLISILVGIKKKKLLFVIDSNVLISKKESTIDDLSIEYKGNPIDSLSVSKIALVNIGRSTITSSDVAIAAPLRITVTQDCQIFSSEILLASTESNLFVISTINPNTVQIDFDYVDKKEGVLLQIIHSGSISSLECHGIVKGGEITSPNLKTRDKVFSRIVRSTFRKIDGLRFSFYMSTGYLVLLVSLGLLSINNKYYKDLFLVSATDNIIAEFWFPYLFALCMLLFMWIISLTQMRKKGYFLPKSFREYFRN